MQTALSKAQNVKTRNDLISLIKERGITHIKVGFFDLDGVMVSNFSFCAVIFGWDIADKLCEGLEMTGWDTGYTDVEIEILPFTYRELPLENKTILVQGQVVDELKVLCSRQISNSVLKKAEAMDSTPYSGFKYEFLAINDDFYGELLQLYNEMELPIEGLHKETGPGQLEVALEVMETSHAADNAALFKVFSKLFAQCQNRMVSFMAKRHSDYSGQGGHIHVSLKNKDGCRAFYDGTKFNKISDGMRWFIGGLQRYASVFIAIRAHNIK